jgi:hypothetical protein
MHKMRLRLAKPKASLLLGVPTIKNSPMAKPVDYTIGQLRKKLKEEGWLVWGFQQNEGRKYYAKHLKTGEEFDGTLAEFKLLAKNVLSL